ncbi:MAG: cation diffusion facilitator family transporter [Patescibacteria group bacterium]
MSKRDSREQNIKIAVFLNVSFTILEIIGGLFTNSLTILSDALHDFGDSVTLISSWVLEKKAKKKPDARRTFGYQRLSLLSALFASIVLVGGSLFILSKAIPRLLNPEHVNAKGMIILAVIGIIFNGLGFLRLKKGASVNEKVLTWHLLEDVLGWVVVFVGSVIILFWDSHIIDPIMTIGYTVFIFWGVTKNLKEAFNIFLQGVPAHIDTGNVKKGLISLKGVIGVHDIHIWSLEGETDIFTGHIVVDEKLLQRPDDTRRLVKKELDKHHIEHSTIELESEHYCSGIECEVDNN